jgi:signal transduction histidine kinase
MGSSGTLTVRVSNRKKTAEITIADTGPGIAVQDLLKMFTPFFTTKTNGTGLGLAYSRKVVQAMGGNIRIYNLDPGPGACLAISLLKV